MGSAQPNLERYNPMRKPNDAFYFYNSIRTQMTVFLSLFSNMKVVDVSEDVDEYGEPITTSETPIEVVWTPKERKYVEELYDKSRTTDQLKLDTRLPKLSVSLTGLTYDPSRQLNFYRTRKIRSRGKLYYDRMPVPYNLSMEVEAFVKYEEHLHQISENILPFFCPYIIVRMKEHPNKFFDDVPKELRIDFAGNVGRDVTFEWLNTEKRILKTSFPFEIKGWIYKPINEAPRILRIPINIFKREDMVVPRDLVDYTEVIHPTWQGNQ